MKLILILALFLGGCSHIDISDDQDWDDIKLEVELDEIKRG